MYFGCSDATLTGGGIVMENVGSTQVCVALDSTPTSEVNVALETDDTPTGAQGKLLYLSACSTFKHINFSWLHLSFMMAIEYFPRTYKNMRSAKAKQKCIRTPIILNEPVSLEYSA